MLVLRNAKCGTRNAACVALRSTRYFSTNRCCFGATVKSAYYPNFDYIRLLAAFQVLAWHTGTKSLVIFDPVTLFIAVSGFVVLGSMERRPPMEFFAARALRVLPLLFVTFIVIGFIHGWGKAWDNFIYWLWPFHKLTVVNGVVWTLIYEEILYVVMAGLYRLRFYGTFVPPLLVGLILVLAGYVQRDWFLPGHFQQFGAAFFIGSAIYLLRDQIVQIPKFVMFAFLLSALVFAAHFNYPTGPGNMPAYYLAYTAILIFAVAGPQLPRLPIDLSYSMYLLHSIILSVLWGKYRYGTEMFAVVLSLTVMFGIVAWYLIERPALQLKSRLWRAKTASSQASVAESI